MNLLGTLLGLFLRFGYAAVFLGVMAENAGIPLPGETILLAAGFFASQGHFHLGLVILLAAVGAMVGDNAGYFLGEKVARPFLDRHGRFLLLTPPRLRAVEAFFGRHGDKTILFARFVSGLRVVAALFAGLSGMRWGTFVLYNAAGALLWATAISLLGFFFGESWDLLQKWVGLGGLLTLGVIFLALLLMTLLRHARALRASLTALLPRALGRREGVILLVNLTALAVFSKIVEDVVSGEATRLDRALLFAIHAHGGPLLNALSVGLSTLGSVPVIVLFVTVVAWVLWRQGARREVRALVVAAGIAEGVTLILLYTVRRAHPSLWEVLVHLHRYSFPSGHALAATATYGMAAYLLGQRKPALRLPVQLGAGLLIFAVGLSRVALGANWPTDVLGGFAAGLLILWATIYWYEGNYSVVLEAYALIAGQGSEEARRPEPGRAGKPSRNEASDPAPPPDQP